MRKEKPWIYDLPHGARAFVSRILIIAHKSSLVKFALVEGKSMPKSFAYVANLVSLLFSQYQENQESVPATIHFDGNPLKISPIRIDEEGKMETF